MPKVHISILRIMCLVLSRLPLDNLHGCACNCQFSGNYDSEQDPLRVVHRFRNTIPEEDENEGESEAKAEAKAEAAADELK